MNVLVRNKIFFNFLCYIAKRSGVQQRSSFAEFIRDKTLNAYEELVTSDVVSLFTKFPVDLAVKVAEERLKQDASLGQRTSLPVEDIIHLLSFCLKTTQFAYNGTYYQQVFGTAMGSPVSAGGGLTVYHLHSILRLRRVNMFPMS